MKSHTKMTITSFGVAGALAFAVGFGGLGAGPVASAPATHAAPSAPIAAPHSPAAGPVQRAVLTTCISGLNC